MQFSSSYANRKWNLFLIKGIQRKQNNNNEKFPSCFSPNKFLLKLKSQEQMLEQTAYIQAVMSSRFLDGNSNPIFPKPWSSPFPAPQRWNLESAIRFEWVYGMQQNLTGNSTPDHFVTCPIIQNAVTRQDLDVANSFCSVSGIVYLAITIASVKRTENPFYVLTFYLLTAISLNIKTPFLTSHVTARTQYPPVIFCKFQLIT